MRDFLYARMRGHEADEEREDEAAPAPSEAAAPAGDELAGLLREVRDELAATRKALEARS